MDIKGTLVMYTWESSTWISAINIMICPWGGLSAEVHCETLVLSKSGYFVWLMSHQSGLLTEGSVLCPVCLFKMFTFIPCRLPRARVYQAFLTS